MTDWHYSLWAALRKEIDGRTPSNIIAQIALVAELVYAVG
jgi:hypothetical protein